MTITSINRNGLLPPGCVDGFCTTCKREAVVSETDPRCPYCKRALDPRSLPSAPGDVRAVAQAVQSGADVAAAPVEPVRAIAARNEAVAATPEVKVRVLSPTRAARRWDAATDELLVEKEAAERTAKAKFEAAKRAADAARAEYEAAAQEARYVRQLQQALRVDGLPAATAPAKPKVKRSASGKHGGRCAAPNPCKGCQRQQEAQTHE